MGGRFMEDPEIEAALSGGGRGAPAFMEDPEIEAALQPRGRSTTGGEVDPSIPPQRSSWDEGLSLLADARDRDLASNGGIAPTERASEALVGANIPGARAGGSYIGNMARNAVSGGVQGGLAAYRGSSNPLDWLQGAGRGAIMGAGLTGAGTAAGAAGSKIAEGADYVGGMFGRGADEARILATGKPPADVERLGAAGRQELASNIEGAGLQNGWGPATPKTYARNAGALADRGEQGMRTAEDQINALPEPPIVPIDQLVAQQRQKAAQVRGLADPANEGAGGFRRQLADNLANDTVSMNPPSPPPVFSRGRMVPPPPAPMNLSWERALEQRRNIDENTSFGAQGNAEPWNNATRKEVGGQLRGAIDNALNTPNVPPDMAQQWRTGRDQTALGLGVQEDAYKAMGQQGPMPIPTSTHAAMVGAAGLGTRMGGYSALAGAQRGAQGLARGVEGVVGTNSEALTGLSQQGGGALGSAASQNSSIKEWLAAKGVTVNNVPQQSRGNQLGTAALELLQTEPQAFGQYTQQIQQAAQQGPEALNSLIGQLEGETPFRTGPMLRLQHMSGEN